MFDGPGELVRTPQFEPRSTQSAETARSERSERATPSRGEERSDESSLRARQTQKGPSKRGPFVFDGPGELVRTPQFEPRSTQSAETARSERSERATPSRGEERSDESSLRARQTQKGPSKRGPFVFDGPGELVRTPQFEPRSTQSAETARSERSERATPSRGEERSDESSLRARQTQKGPSKRGPLCLMGLGGWFELPSSSRGRRSRPRQRAASAVSERPPRGVRSAATNHLSGRAKHKRVPRTEGPYFCGNTSV